MVAVCAVAEFRESSRMCKAGKSAAVEITSLSRLLRGINVIGSAIQSQELSRTRIGAFWIQAIKCSGSVLRYAGHWFKTRRQVLLL